ncbi:MULTISPECIES: hypothetical protein [Thalassospira]|uniref:Uncharacterized protein n=2 Tax=Thalassospira TaxID=168934 RepID=A0A367W2B1_9PROT|nr:MULTISPECIES: hypothetical protein [Thalassospira]MDG4720112.1 hypothetical protein [Thalassospira sp. FZY0004]RCK31768.1 hypothetical protein TH19_20330 [Thalassospira profundimaris]
MKRTILRRLPAIIGLVGAVFLLSLAVPRTISSITYELTTPVFDNRNNPQISEEQLLEIKDDLLYAISWVDNPVTWSRLGYVYLALGNRSTAPDQKTLNLEEAENAFTNAVAGSPMDPYYWLRLSYARLLSGGKNDGSAVEALKMSLLTGPYERPIAVEQIQYAALLWDQLDDEQQNIVREKVRWISGLENKKLLTLAKSNIEAMTVILSALADGDLNRFTRFIKALNKT